jgi:hypothetical protein
MSTSSDDLQATKKYRYVFTRQEDVILEQLVERFGFSSWDVIAAQLPGRSSRQCRERWFTYLAPEINRTPWSTDEDALLFDLMQIHGTKWGAIAGFFCNRTQNNVKNRSNTIVRKARALGLNPSNRNHFIETGHKIASRSTRPFFEPERPMMQVGPQIIYRLENLLN